MLQFPATLTHDQATACLSGWLTQLSAGAAGPVVLDAAPLAAFDSTALAVVLELRRHLLARKQSLQLVGTPRRLTDLAALYGVEELLAA